MTRRRKLLEKLRAVGGGGAAFNDVVTLLEAYGFERRRVAGSHWFFSYTDKDGNRIRVGFPVVNGKSIKAFYVKDVVDAVDQARAESED